METIHTPITAKRFHDALCVAGVIREEDKVRHIVIEADIDQVVRIYIERVGDERLLEVIPTLGGVQIATGE